MDIVYIGAGVLLFAVFGAYAFLLRGV